MPLMVKSLFDSKRYSPYTTLKTCHLRSLNPSYELTTIVL